MIRGTEDTVPKKVWKKNFSSLGGDSEQSERHRGHWPHMESACGCLRGKDLLSLSGDEGTRAGKSR